MFLAALLLLLFLPLCGVHVALGKSFLEIRAEMWESIQPVLTLFLYVTQTTADGFVVGPLSATDIPNNGAAELGSRGSIPPPTCGPAVGKLELLGRQAERQSHRAH